MNHNIFSFRIATPDDIAGIQRVRHLVKENVLSDPALVTDEDCRQNLTERGKGWVSIFGDRIVGFSIADLQENNIWALFVDPDFEGKRIGKTLHRLMLDWYFSTGKEDVWLSTSPKTRAERFYKEQGWKENGFHGSEIRFEMSWQTWNTKSSRDSK